MKAKRILLVEDSPDDVKLTERAFKKSNILNEMIVATDGAEALRFLFGGESEPGLAFEEMPMLILLDLKLPKVDGIEVLRRLRSDARTKLIPVVILTSSKEERDRVAGYTLGANSYIQKPVDFMRFTEVVIQLGLYWLVLNEPPPIPSGGAHVQ